MLNRVTDSEGRVNPATPDMITNKLFGTTNGDTLTFKQLIEGCSFNHFQVSTNYPVDISQHLSAEGVIDVNIGISLEEDRLSLTSTAQLAVEEKIGYPLSIFHHLLMIFEGCYTADCGYGAFAYSSGIISGYIGDYWSYPSVVVHEIGHNLNLHVSKEESCSYFVFTQIKLIHLLLSLSIHSIRAVWMEDNTVIVLVLWDNIQQTIKQCVSTLQNHFNLLEEEVIGMTKTALIQLYGTRALEVVPRGRDI